MNTFKTKFLQKTVIMGIILVLFIPGIKAQELLTLDKALKYAENNSPDIKQSLLNLTRYQKNLEAQRASLKSSFSLSVNPVSFNRSRQFYDYESKWYTSESLSSSSTFTVSQPILLTNGTVALNNEFGWEKSLSDASNTESKVFYNNLYLSFNQPLFTYNSLKMELKRLELNLEDAKISYSIQRLEVEKNVTQYFYNVYLEQMNLQIAKSELDNTQKNYDIIKNKVEAGLSAKEELYQQELELANAKSSVQNQEVTFENAKDQLKLYLGMDLYEEISVIDIDLSNTTAVDVDLEKAINNGLTSRMELRQREIDIESSMFDLVETKALNEFKGSMDLRVGITGDNKNIGNIYETPTKSPSVALSFNIPIFDWGEKKARIAAQEATIESQKLNYSDEKNTIIIAIRQSYRSLQNYWSQIGIAKQTEKNAELTYEINQEKYANGDLTGMDLSLYQTQLSEAKVSYAQAQINYRIELLNLKIQSLFDFAKKEPVLPAELYLNEEN